MQTETISINTNAVLREQADELFAEFGLDISSAINLFLRQAVREKAIPFAVRLPKRRIARVAKTPQVELEKTGFGCMKGEIWMAEDFNAPLDDFREYM